MDWQQLLLENWHVKFVSIVLIYAAYIDGKELRVPNWITYPMVLSGLIYMTWTGGPAGLGWGLLGMVVGLATLLPLYSVGGMGAGDVKLMAGIGAWLGVKITFYAFCVTTVVGAVMAVAMVLYRKKFYKHLGQAIMILDEWRSVKNPRELSRIAKERKPTMFLLPYGIPICIGSIAYFFYAGLL
ncbi:Type IV leader peptidase family protein [Gimesia maris]|uniref:A24 family peptidase n=1 Tax=Gimesia maris TaxID=122 RepID=UPI00118B5D9D|nr:A24 family peptidase [Gimesia maris]QDU14891.1 Type IV leader peptidase family protein [Gimesia maris]